MTYTGIIDQKNLISLCNCPFNYFCPWYHKAGEGDEDQNISTILIEFFKRISAREIRITRSFFAYRPSGTIEEVKEMNKAVKIIQMLIRLVGLVLPHPVEPVFLVVETVIAPLAVHEQRDQYGAGNPNGQAQDFD